MAQFSIEHLSEDGLAEAWPVVQQSHSHARSGWWISEAKALIERGGGVLAARAPDGTIHGVATYEVARKALLGRALAVDTLVAFELSRRAPVRHALCDALELLAGVFDCRTMVLPLSSKRQLEDGARTVYGRMGFGPPDRA